MSITRSQYTELMNILWDEYAERAKRFGRDHKALWSFPGYRINVLSISYVNIQQA
jgi:hypothetical protein